MNHNNVEVKNVNQERSKTVNCDRCNEAYGEVYVQMGMHRGRTEEELRLIHREQHERRQPEWLRRSLEGKQRLLGVQK